MSTPLPDPRPVVRDTTKRDALIAVLIGILVLAFVGYGIMSMNQQSQTAAGNTLTGEVVEKRSTTLPKEQQITYGRGGLKEKTVDGEYILVVRVAEENRTFDVPVEKSVYETKRIGDQLTFLRPPSEQLKPR
jgi:hypothetical protein